MNFKMMLTGLLTTCVLCSVVWAEDVQPWPAAVPGWKAPEAGEHPRLFFRKADLPEIKKRAATPEGLAIIKRLGLLLDGKEGKTLPAILPQPGVGAPKAKMGEAMTLWHPCGYGMLYHLTGDKLYADLGKQAMEHILTDTGDIDGRYSYIANSNKNYGALRAGPSIGAVAMGYDLCYDGWDEAFRAKVVAAILAGPSKFPLADLVHGLRHGPHSNHWGCQIGGGALAILAIWKDSGVDNAKIESLMEDSKKLFVRQLTEGFGDGGMFNEGQGAGGIGSDTAFIPAIQAWRVAGGQDFVSPQPNAAAIPMLKVQQMLRVKGEPWYPVNKASGYGTGYMGTKGNSDRDGLSRAGQFSQGFGIIPDQIKPAALWVYNHILEPDSAAYTYDTVSPFPHRAVLALVNWPIGVKEVNPATLMPKVHWDNRFGLYTFRNQWTGTEDDIVVDATTRARDGHGLMVWGKGERRVFGAASGLATHVQASEDGSGTLTVGTMMLGVDFSKASGADGLIVTVGLPMTGAKQVEAGRKLFNILLLGGSSAEPVANGDKVVVGQQEITCDGFKIIFKTMAAPQKMPRLGIWSGVPTIGDPVASSPLITRAVKPGEKMILGIRQPPPKDAVVVEAESFEQQICDIVDDEQASGGKAIRLVDRMNSQATTKVDLPKGRFAVEIWIKATDADKDAVFLGVGSKPAMPISPQRVKYPMTDFAPCRLKELLVQDTPGKVDVIITPLETGMLIDQVVFLPQGGK